MLRVTRTPLLLVLALLAATFTFIAQPLPAAQAGENPPALQGNYVPLSVPTRVFTGTISGQVKTSFPGAGVTGVPLSGTTAVVAVVSITATNHSAVLEIGTNASGGARWYQRGTAAAQTAMVPTASTVTVPIDDTVASNQLFLYDLSGYTGSVTSTASVQVSIIGYYTRLAVGGGYVGVRQTALPDSFGAIPIPAGGTRTFSVRPVGGPVPATATAVYLNLVASGSTAAGGIVATPTGASATGVDPVLRFYNGVGSISNFAIVKPAANGNVTFTNTSTKSVSFSASVEGYVTDSPSTGGDWHRALAGRWVRTLNANEAVDIDLTQMWGVPTSGVAGAVLGIETIQVQTGGLKIYPTGTAAPTPTAISFNPPLWRYSQVVVAPGVGGKVTVKNTSTASVELAIVARSWFDTPTTYAVAGGSKAFSVARTSAGPCYGYIDPASFAVKVGCSEDYGAEPIWSPISPSGERFRGKVAMVSRPDGHLVVVARHAPDGEVWSWDVLPSSGLMDATPVRHYRYTNAPVAVATLSNGTPVGFAKDSSGRFWSIDLSAVAPEQPVWKPLDGSGLTSTVIDLTASLGASGIRLVATTSNGDVAVTRFPGLSSTSLYWYNLSVGDATGPASLGLTQSGAMRVAVKHTDGTVWSGVLDDYLGVLVGSWQQVNSLYVPTNGDPSYQVAVATSPTVIYDPKTGLSGILFGSTTALFYVWETAPGSGDFSGTLKGEADTTGVDSDFTAFDLRDEYPDTGRRWGVVYWDTYGGKKFAAPRM